MIARRVGGALALSLILFGANSALAVEDRHRTATTTRQKFSRSSPRGSEIPSTLQPPSNVSATARSCREVVVSWSPATSGTSPDGYKVHRYKQLLGTVGSTKFTYTDTNPVSGKQSYNVTAYDSAGSKSASPDSVEVPSCSTSGGSGTGGGSGTTGPLTPLGLLGGLGEIRGVAIDRTTATAVVTSNSGVHFVDVTAPSAPRLLHSVPASIQTGRRVQIRNGIAYVSASVASGGGAFSAELQTWDLAPAVPEKTSATRLTSNLPALGFAEVQVDGDFVYTTSQRGLHVFDLRSDPRRPVLIGTVAPSETPLDFAVRGGWVYIDTKSKSVVVDARDPRRPLISQETSSTIALYNIAGNTLFAPSSYSILIYDVASPPSRRILGEFRGPKNDPIGVGRWLITGGSTGVVVADIANRAAAMQVQSVNSSTNVSALGADGSLVVSGNTSGTLRIYSLAP